MEADRKHPPEFYWPEDKAIQSTQRALAYQDNEDDNTDQDEGAKDPGEVIMIEPIKCDGRTAVDQKYPARPVAQIRYDTTSKCYHIRLDDPKNPSFWAEVIFAGCDIRHVQM
jgi:hypothetical protein